jgi:hypothetical protein
VQRNLDALKFVDALKLEALSLEASSLETVADAPAASHFFIHSICYAPSLSSSSSNTFPLARTYDNCGVIYLCVSVCVCQCVGVCVHVLFLVLRTK